MLNEFTSIYYDDEKIDNAFGESNSAHQLKNAKRIFGGRGKVFFEYGRDESSPVYGREHKDEIIRATKSRFLRLSHENRSPSGLTIIGMYGTDSSTGSARYDLRYVNQHCNPIINPKASMSPLHTYETKKYFSIDMEYILMISRAFTDYDFSVFDGEGLRILKAWIFVMTYGVHHPEEEGLVMVQASKNEYGENVRNRVLVRNSYYDGTKRYKYYGAPYAESSDDEWALSADDYAKVAALDTIMTELSKSTPMVHEGTIIPDLIAGSRQYGALVPDYFISVLGMKTTVRQNNI